MNDDEIYAKRLEEQERGRSAAELLANPLLIEAFEVCRDAYMSALENTGFKQSAEREELWRRLQTLKKVREHLETVATTGRLAKEQLKELRFAARDGRWASLF